MFFYDKSQKEVPGDTRIIWIPVDLMTLRSKNQSSCLWFVHHPTRGIYEINSNVNQPINQKIKKINFYLQWEKKLIKAQNNPHDHTKSAQSVENEAL
jgi:hypothetical protein